MRIGNTSSQVQKLKRELNQKTNLLDENLFKALNGFSLVFSALANSNLGAKNFNLTGKVEPFLSKRNLTGGAQVDELYGAFLEFGTRSQVNVPSEFTNIAKQYKGAKFKSGASFKESIERWIVTKLGKTEEEAKQISFPIMMKILKVGTKPQPYMYPAFKMALKDLYRNIRKEIKNTTK